MAFSISPAVTVSEYDLSMTIPNLPSSRTGMVITSDKGECLTIKAITNESELVNTFGKPTSSNYQNWFQAWNFLQYASSLYVVRPRPRQIATLATSGDFALNASVTFDGLTSPSWDAADNFYNSIIARKTIDEIYDQDGISDGQTATLRFINKNITNTQDLAIAVTSNATSFEKPIARDMYAILKKGAASNAFAPVVTNSRVSTDGDVLNSFNNLIKGNDVLLNFNRKYTVDAVSVASGASADVYTVGFKSAQTTTRAITTKDVAKFVLDVATTNGTSGTYRVNSSTFEVGSVFVNAAGTAAFKITAFSTGATTGTFTFASLSASEISAISGFGSISGTDGVPTATVFTSNVGLYSGTVSNLSATSGPAITMNPGFTFVVGSNFSGKKIVDVDRINNIIYLEASTNVTKGQTVTAGTIFESVLVATSGYESYFGDSLIKRSRVLVTLPDNTQTYYTKQALVTFDDMFEYEPDFSNGEFVSVILKKNNSGVYELEESFRTSYVKGAKDEQGRVIYATEFFYTGSKNFFCLVGTSDIFKVDTAEQKLARMTDVVSDAGGAKSQYRSYVKGDVQFAAELFSDSESFDINILIAHELDLNVMSEIAESRKDCVAIVAPCTTTHIANMTTQSNSDVTTYLCREFGSVYPANEGDDKDFGTFGTYSAFYGNLKYQYDKFNDVNRWIAPMGDVAGLYAQTDANRDPWWAPAGIDRGKIKNVIKLAFNPNKANRDDLYYNAINPIITVAGEGIGIVFGQKTTTRKPSAFDRVNVRRLLITLEKAISTAARYSLFEFNDAFTRNRLKGMIEPYLRFVKSRRGLYDFMVVIDETNNTGEVIDKNALVIDIYLKPVRVAEFIQINAFVTRTDANFAEIIGKP